MAAEEMHIITFPPPCSTAGMSFFFVDMLCLILTKYGAVNYGQTSLIWSHIPNGDFFPKVSGFIQKETDLLLIWFSIS